MGKNGLVSQYIYFEHNRDKIIIQELIDLRQSIVEGRYRDALDLVDELEGMGKQAIYVILDFS